jgi:hypothetical protein
MTKTPTFIPLLNSVSRAETAAGAAFTEWAQTTTDKRLAKTLRLVAMRESEHGIAFAKRMLELNAEVYDDGLDFTAELTKVVASKRSDLSKMKALGFNKSNPSPDIFDAFFRDKTIDPTTGARLWRYICEERDTGRLLRTEHDRLHAAEKKRKARANR